ncbi:MAG TPA: NAD(P)/FAD-dependent oxidoreductase [Candidatus Binataceae bacterium]|nr:NAD(P)/FAD-dependent oxidoreductase [Candidatus Binataceae bacterium]
MATIAEQTRRDCEGRIRTLIVGAGVAGLTLAALLRQRGERPVLVERARDLSEGGYNIALYPLGSRVLHGLGLYDRLLATSQPFHDYQLGNGRGETIHRFDLRSLVDRYGPILGLRRHELLEVLRAGAPEATIVFDATVASMREQGGSVEVSFSDGSAAGFDLVVGADGINSALRQQLLAPSEYAYWDSEWGCWLAWAPPGLMAPTASAEYWGASRFLGIYPVRDGFGIFFGAPRTIVKASNHRTLARELRTKMSAGLAQEALAAIEASQNPFIWDLHDCRSAHWCRGRVSLLGDSAAAFLPTAGVGASMAMLSAAALADELTRVDAAHVDYALRLFERRDRKRVEAAQNNSRRLARLIMVDSVPMAWGRDQLMKFYSLDRALKEVVELMEGSI